MLLVLITLFFREPVDPVGKGDGICCLGGEACVEVGILLIMVIILIIAAIFIIMTFIMIFDA